VSLTEQNQMPRLERSHIMALIPSRILGTES